MTTWTHGSRAWAVGIVAGVLLLGAHLATGTHLAGDRTEAASPGEDVDRHLTVNVTAIECPEDYDNQADDDVCLAYDGQIPGPTFVFAEGQRVQLEVRHNVSVTELGADPAVAEKLEQARYTLHRHGVSVAACEDGVARPRGTQVCDSTIQPGGTVTYNFTTRFPGFWHYHDHALGLDVGTTHGEEAGAMAEHRGLWGSFLVVPEDETAGEVLDLHLLDTGPNGGLGLDANVTAGERFDLIAAGLGDAPWRVTLTAPDGTTVWREDLGPGVSRGHTVAEADPGTYTWRAASPLVGSFEGEVVAE